MGDLFEAARFNKAMMRRFSSSRVRIGCFEFNRFVSKVNRFPVPLLVGNFRPNSMVPHLIDITGRNSYTVIIMTTGEQLSLADKLGAVSRNTLAEQVAVILKRFVLLETIPEGRQLPSERSLVAALGVSHRVVREALSILQGEGLISKEHGRGSFVQRFDRDRLQAAISILPQSVPDPKTLLEARCAFESGNMCIAARNATADDLAQLQTLVDRMKGKAERGESPSAEDQKFHLTLLQATHNPTLIAFGYLIKDSLRLYVYNRPGLLHRSVQEESRAIRTHQNIIDALRRRDGASAAEAMVDHLRKGIDQVT